MISVEIGHLTVRKIYSYLSENDHIFTPPLSKQIVIKNFATKLNKFAIHFCVFQNNELVGFSACYFNNMETGIGFISTLSVIRELHGKGVAKKLLTSVVEYGINNGFKQISLQVNNSNLSAKRLYAESGFIEVSQNLNMTEMALDLQIL
jgi:ribosomal protein S18 acetylase RimI-like enzyme